VGWVGGLGAKGGMRWRAGQGTGMGVVVPPAGGGGRRSPSRAHLTHAPCVPRVPPRPRLQVTTSHYHSKLGVEVPAWSVATHWGATMFRFDNVYQALWVLFTVRVEQPVCNSLFVCKSVWNSVWNSPRPNPICLTLADPPPNLPNDHNRHNRWRRWRTGR
jgi:hypothetical protein